MTNIVVANEIIKALECCGKSHRECRSECPRYNNEMYASDCRRDLLIKANLLAKRQQAEIERLEKAAKDFEECFHRMDSLYHIKCMELKVARAEAIKEFAERLKAKAHGFLKEYNGINLIEIDNLVKEMIGETNDR